MRIFQRHVARTTPVLHDELSSGPLPKSKVAMRGPLASKLLALLPRVPVPVLGLMIVASSLQAACTDMGDLAFGSDAANTDATGAEVDAAGPDAPDADATPDAPSDDSPDDRADGMRYGDAYGP
jgi:hypothetical protein